VRDPALVEAFILADAALGGSAGDATAARGDAGAFPVATDRPGPRREEGGPAFLPVGVARSRQGLLEVAQLPAEGGGHGDDSTPQGPGSAAGTPPDGAMAAAKATSRRAAPSPGPVGDILKPVTKAATDLAKLTTSLGGQLAPGKIGNLSASVRDHAAAATRLESLKRPAAAQDQLQAAITALANLSEAADEVATSLQENGASLHLSALVARLTADSALNRARRDLGTPAGAETPEGAEGPAAPAAPEPPAVPEEPPPSMGALAEEVRGVAEVLLRSMASGAPRVDRRAYAMVEAAGKSAAAAARSEATEPPTARAAMMATIGYLDSLVESANKLADDMETAGEQLHGHAGETARRAAEAQAAAGRLRGGELKGTPGKDSHMDPGTPPDAVGTRQAGAHAPAAAPPAAAEDALVPPTPGGWDAEAPDRTPPDTTVLESALERPEPPVQWAGSDPSAATDVPGSDPPATIDAGDPAGSGASLG
jgi:hypothetical protein